MKLWRFLLFLMLKKNVLSSINLHSTLIFQTKNIFVTKNVAAVDLVEFIRIKHWQMSKIWLIKANRFADDLLYILSFRLDLFPFTCCFVMFFFQMTWKVALFYGRSTPSRHFFFSFCIFIKIILSQLLELHLLLLYLVEEPPLFQSSSYRIEKEIIVLKKTNSISLLAFAKKLH
jgi:hypothetical protein